MYSDNKLPKEEKNNSHLFKKIVIDAQNLEHAFHQDGLGCRLTRMSSSKRCNTAETYDD